MSGNRRYFKCNLDAKQGRYDQVGVVMVYRHDLAKRETLLTVVTRFGSKGCYFAEAQTGHGTACRIREDGRRQRIRKEAAVPRSSHRRDEDC